MRIYKVISNNVVSVKNEKGQEILFKGLSIGFGKKSGDLLDESKIEKKFVMDDQVVVRKFEDLVVNFDKQVVECCLEIVSDIKKESKNKISDSLYVTLIDHINALIDRMQEGIKFDNAVLWDMKRIYPDEYLLATQAIKKLNCRLAYDFPLDEATFITLHIVNAELDNSMADTFRLTDTINDICKIVESDVPFVVDENDYYYNRFIMHLRFLIENQGNRATEVHRRNETLLSEVVKLYPVLNKIVGKISDYLLSRLGWELSHDERLYLIIHLVQIFHR